MGKWLQGLDHTLPLALASAALFWLITAHWLRLGGPPQMTGVAAGWAVLTGWCAALGFAARYNVRAALAR